MMVTRLAEQLVETPLEKPKVIAAADFGGIGLKPTVNCLGSAAARIGPKTMFASVRCCNDAVMLVMMAWEWNASR